MTDEPRRGWLAPTRKLIIVVLGGIAALGIGSATALAMYGVTIPDALTTIAATAVGGIATMAAAAASSGD